MADHGGALRAARPVLAGAIVAGRERGAVGLRSRQHVVAVRRVAAAVDDIALFAQCSLLAEIVAGAVEVGDVFGDHGALGVLPGSLADAVARIHGGLAVGGLRRQIRAPDLWSAGTCGLRQRLTVIVGAGEATEIAAIADAVAGQEETGVGRLRRCRLRGDYGNGEAERRNDLDEGTHEGSPDCSCWQCTEVNPPRRPIFLLRQHSCFANTPASPTFLLGNGK